MNYIIKLVDNLGNTIANRVASDWTIACKKTEKLCDDFCLPFNFEIFMENGKLTFIHPEYNYIIVEKKK